MCFYYFFLGTFFWPSVTLKIDLLSIEPNTILLQKFPLSLIVAAKPRQRNSALRVNDAMPRNIEPPRKVVHRISDETCLAWETTESCNPAVRSDSSFRNSSHRFPDSLIAVGRRTLHQLTECSATRFPSLSSNTAMYPKSGEICVFGTSTFPPDFLILSRII